MAFEDSVFMREVREVIDKGTRNAFWRWEATLHADGKNMGTHYVDNVDILRDYLSNAFDVITVEVGVLPATFEKFFVPNKDILEITLKRTPLSETGNSEVEAESAQSYRYRAMLYDAQSGVVEGTDPTLQRIDVGDNANIRRVRLQLTDPVVEQLRLKTVGGVMRNTTALNAVRTMLGAASKTVKNAEDVVAVHGVDLAAGGIDVVRDHVIVPHMTKLVNMPQYVHENQGGLYNGGFGYYLQNGIWFLYAPFDIKRYPKAKRTLTVLNVPAERFPSPERSYRTTEQQVIVLATGEVKHTDVSEELQVNLGNGVRFADANRLFTSFVEVTGNKATASRGKNTAEFVYEDRRTKVNNAQASPVGITANYPVERGRIAARAGSYIQLVWEASDASLLYPGMPTKIMYLENGRAQELYGILVGAHTFFSQVNMGIKERRFMSKTAMLLFVDKKISFDDPDYVK